MQPEVADAVASLKERGVLGDPPASYLLRVARDELVSVRLEIRTVLYLGVLLLTTGVGLFVKENHDRIGPAAIASGLGLAAALCILVVIRRAAAFTWGQAPGSGVAFDYILLLGLLLVAADLAYVEVQFRLLGASWPIHLFAVAVLSGAAAFRWDSPVALSLALSSFAAWRGVSVNLLAEKLGPGRPGETRGNAIVCGLLFVLAGVLLVRARRKAHFEDVFLNFGLVLLFGALLSGVYGDRVLRGWWLLTLAIVAAAVIAAAVHAGRTLYFAEGVLAAYLGLLRFLWGIFESRRMEAMFFLVVAVSATGVLGLIVTAHRRMRER
ncbi:MAG: hypothetical protein ACHQPI_06520 [Thermoanaerobaculia bacterium]